MGYVAYFLPQIIAQTLKSCRSNMFLLCQTSLGGKLLYYLTRNVVISTKSFPARGQLMLKDSKPIKIPVNLFFEYYI